jgi:PIN domain nuclease of toxin-antitoxin system
MILLLDTHAALWFWWDDPRLSVRARALICDPSNRKLASVATPWEVAIKVSLKKLDIGGPYPGFFPQHMGRTFFEWLHASDRHLTAVASLPFHHRDPFDRLIAAQALVEGTPLVSADAIFDAYGVSRIWN